MTKETAESVLSAAARAAELLDEGTLSAVMLVGVHKNAAGVRYWMFGDENVTDRLRETMRAALPLTSSRYDESIPYDV